MRDTLFQRDVLPGSFVFDDKVAAVFEDMINRSVPGYATIIKMIGTLSARYVQPHSRLYDMGCSLGAATLAMRQQLLETPCTIVAIDNSEPMLVRFEALLAKQRLHDTGPVIELKCEDILAIDIHDASVVVLNFTLQFIPLAKRQKLMQKIAAGMRKGALLIVSEKILSPDQDLNELCVELHHRFKAEQGYSDLEISSKRAAIENVLIPETINAHEERIRNAGFSSFAVWFQCFNFASFVAVK
jgi:tRNA (cmo5U34)-methyltransferase